MADDAQYMRRAMELACLGLGEVSPNPMVGCVVVHNDRIIGEGWHQKFGEAHAEVNAIKNVKDHSLLSSATVYVNLEPCSHFGKTPPCADLLIEKKVRRVVIANRDTNPQVAGAGIEKMKAAGMEIEEGVCQEEGRWVNRRFFTRVEESIPYIILKWAQSADKKIAPSDGKSIWISNAHSRQRVHQWRTQEDAVLVGSRTAEVDNPHLNVRDWTGRNPVRVVIDPSLRLDSKLHLFDGTQPTLRYNRITDEGLTVETRIRIDGEDLIPAILADLNSRNISSVIVEGGLHTLQGFITGGWWHEARIFQSPRTLGGGIQAPQVSGVLNGQEEISGDQLSVWINPERVRTAPGG